MTPSVGGGHLVAGKYDVLELDRSVHLGNDRLGEGVEDRDRLFGFDDIADFHEEFGTVANIDQIIANAKDKDDPLPPMGFGHRVYKHCHSRAQINPRGLPAGVGVARR